MEIQSSGYRSMGSPNNSKTRRCTLVGTVTFSASSSASFDQRLRLLQVVDQVFGEIGEVAEWALFDFCVFSIGGTHGFPWCTLPFPLCTLLINSIWTARFCLYIPFYPDGPIAQHLHSGDSSCLRTATARSRDQAVLHSLETNPFCLTCCYSTGPKRVCPLFSRSQLAKQA